jgi:hypothetical protein
MIEPVELAAPGSELQSVVDELPEGAQVKILFEGIGFGGNELSRTALLTLGREGPLSIRFAPAGLSLFESNGVFRVGGVVTDMAADNYGVVVGMEVAAVYVPNPDRKAKELFFIPAFAGVGLVYFIQRRRRSAARA